jgi:hypothetical protein
MPFNRPFPRSFTTSSIRDHAPAVSGVYGISNAAEWIYIGESDNIQEALLGHLQGSSKPVLTRSATGFVFEICEWTKRPARQDRLIFEYEPACNRHRSELG